MSVDFNKWASVGICILCGALFFYFAIAYALPIILPFLLSWVISVAITPVANYIARKTRASVKPISVILMLSALGLVVLLLFLIFSRVLYEVQNFAAWLGEGGALETYIENARAFFEGLGSSNRFFEYLFEGGGFLSAWNGVDEMLSDIISEAVKNISASIPSFVASVFRALPNILLFLAVSVIASFYFCLWRESINAFFVSLLPQKIAKKVPELKKSISGTALGYFKAYALIFVMTFSELFVGFLILGVKYSFILAFIIAIIDMLPVFGTGIVLVPWSIILLLGKNFYLGFGLIIMYAIILIVRQIAEPKIVGKSIGLPPLVTLFSMYAGFRLIGLLGMLLGPVCALVVKSFLPERIKNA